MSEPMATACYCGVCATCGAQGGGAPRPAVADPLVFRQSAIKQRMLDNIGSTQIDGLRPLAGLGVRDDADPTIAFLDAVAGGLHILGWNIGRLSDDGALPRTEDRDALVDLTRLLGYEPRPALSATTTLAFTVDDREGAPKAATIPKGSKIASSPLQNQMPQTFETDAELDARAEWNLLKPVLGLKHQLVSKATMSVVLKDASTPAKVGDLVLIRTQPKGAAPASALPWLCARIQDLKRDANPAGGGPPQTQLTLTSPLQLAASPNLSRTANQDTVIVLGQRAAAFGATAPDLVLMTDDIRISQTPGATAATAKASLATDWDKLVMDLQGANGGQVDLDAVYPDALAGRVAVFSDRTHPKNPLIADITEVSEGSRKDFGLSAKITSIEVNGIGLGTRFRNRVRQTMIWLETAHEQLLVADLDEILPAATAPDSLRVTGQPDLPIGRRIVLTGTAWSDGSAIGEVATLKSSSNSGGATELVFEQPLASRFHSTSLQLFANAVGASHGETPAQLSNGPELIGSGDAGTASPKFQLSGSPLAYVPAVNPLGYAPALEVRVGERLYQETPSLYGEGSDDRVYTVKTMRGGRSEVQFAGRLPSGAHNVTAAYRVGGGVAGNLPSARITTAMAPVVGVSGVTNPVAAEGGSDAETVEDMRVAAPQSIRTLDRVVSLSDFEAFAARYRGVGKVLATPLRAGMRQLVCLTVATTDLTSPVAGADILTSLADAVKQQSPPGRAVRVEGFVDLVAAVTVNLAIDPAYRSGDVQQTVRDALAAAFGRQARRFGEALPRSAVLAAVQGVEGVIAATLPVFQLPGGPPETNDKLPCPMPTLAGDVFQPAGLLSIDPSTVQFTEMTP